MWLTDAVYQYVVLKGSRKNVEITMNDVLLQCEIICSKAAELIDEQAELSAMIEHMKGAREHEGNEIR